MYIGLFFILKAVHSVFSSLFYEVTFGTNKRVIF